MVDTQRLQAADAILDQLLHALAEHNRGYHSDDTAIMVILA